MKNQLSFQDTVLRIHEIAAHDLAASRPEPELDALVRLGQALLGTDVCAITAIGQVEQQFIASTDPAALPTPVEAAFCANTIELDQPLVVLDARKDPRFADNPYVVGPPYVCFYAGAPIKTVSGVRLGAFCVYGSTPRREFSPHSAETLRSLADFASGLIQLRPGARSSAAVRSFVDATALGMVTTDAKGKITSWNAAAEAIFGHKSADVVGQNLGVIIPQRFRTAHFHGIRKAADEKKSGLDGKPVEVTALHAKGHEFPIELSLASWITDDGLSFGAHIQDITRRKARDEELHELARIDPLTGLTNAKSFRDLVDNAVRQAQTAILITIDLDGFKSVNDSLGHAFGDALLQTIALRMRKIAGDDCPVSRLGGDEFAVLLRHEADLFAARALASELLAELRKPILMDGYHLQVGASIGIAMAPDHATDVDELFVRADLAMFRAKKEGGRTVRLFDRTMGDELVARRAFRDELRQASGDRQWELYYQPQFNLEDGKLTGVEALLRWKHPSWGIILPSTFMPVLETHVIAYEVGNWVLDEACRQLAAWRANGLDVPRMSVNLFSAQIYSGSLTARVHEALRKHKLLPTDLEIEITETIALRHDDEALAPLFSLIEEGVGVAFDDFGTGFASLSTIQRFPLTRLKIDRSFVTDICSDPQCIAITGGIIAIGKALNVEIIAEGIETEAQRARLVELGCLQGQGYLYDKGMPAGALEQKYGAIGGTATIGLRTVA